MKLFKSNTSRVIAGALASAVVLSGVATGAVGAVQTNLSDDPFYIYSAGVLQSAGTTYNESSTVTGSSSGSSATAGFQCPAGTIAGYRFVSPRGSERTKSAWIAYASATPNGSGVIVNPSLRLSTFSTLGTSNIASIYASGLNYSLGVACMSNATTVTYAAYAFISTAAATANDAANGALTSWSALATQPLVLTQTPTPTISGAASVGAVLTAVTGTWDSGVTFTYQWRSNGAPISGATGATYTVQAGDAGNTISVAVTGSKAGGYPSVTTTSVETSAVTAVQGSPATIDLTAPVVQIVDGSLSLSIAAGSVTFGAASQVGGKSVATGQLPNITVSDQRYATTKGWDLTVSVNDFTLQGGSATIAKSALGIAPALVAGQTTTTTQTLGASSTAGSATYPYTLASLPQGQWGNTTVTGGLTFVANPGTTPGNYTSTMTVTLLSK